MEKMINGIFAKLSQKGFVNEDSRDVFEYGLDLLLFTLFTNVTLLILGALTGFFFHSFVLMVTFSVLQSICGGYHAQTHMRCFITTATGWIVGRLLIMYVPDILLLLLPLYGVGAVWLIAPLEHENAPMSDGKKARMRKLGRLLVCCFTVIGVALYLLNIVYMRSILTGVFLSGVSLTAGTLMKKK